MTRRFAAHQRLALMDKDVVADAKRSTPKVAMASVDGGRMQIRSNPSEPRQASHWRESKVAVLETYQGEAHQADPDPDVPRCFLDLKRTQEMVCGLGTRPAGRPGVRGRKTGIKGRTREPKRGRTRRPRPGRPQRLVRSVPGEPKVRPKTSARSCIRRPGNGTFRGPARKERSWGMACQCELDDPGAPPFRVLHADPTRLPRTRGKELRVRSGALSRDAPAKRGGGALPGAGIQGVLARARWRRS